LIDYYSCVEGGMAPKKTPPQKMTPEESCRPYEGSQLRTYGYCLEQAEARLEASKPGKLRTAEEECASQAKLIERVACLRAAKASGK
jgi:hypothetical protein